MDALSDDDFERVSDPDLSESDSDQDRLDHETPSSTPPSVRILRASDRKTIPCTYKDCPKTFNRKARLEEHLRSHTNNRVFKCDHLGCGKDFLRDTHLKHHVKSAHTNIRDYRCTWEGCDKSFATGTRLRRHFQAHEGREKYRCRGYEGCSQTFRKHETLKRHITQVHEQMKPFPCPDNDDKTGRQCEKAFDTAEKLRAHQRSQHDSTRFSCTECLSHNAQTANSVSALTTDQFEACFATYSALQAHIAEFHPPVCPYCPTSFTTSKELTRHLEIQHGVIDLNIPKRDTFQCKFPDCDRSFTKKGNLTVHMKTVHEKVKDFVCGETEIVLPEELRPSGSFEVYGCGRAFTSKATLEDHVRSAHLGLTSMQVERKKKRKAEIEDSAEKQVGPELKTRKPRKDKGTKKSSILASLTCAPIQRTHFSEFPIDPALSHSYANENTIESISTTQGLDVDVKDESEDEDEWNQLSGSMTLLDGRLYHYDEQYEYSTPSQPSTHSSRNLTDCALGVQTQAGYNKIHDGLSSTLDNEPFFAGFEHEPESIDGMTTRHEPMVPFLGPNF